MDNQIQRLSEYPFRIFFVSTAAWALLAIPLWILTLQGSLSHAPTLDLLVWHRHEMLFGMVNTGIAGFLMTAACVWTQSDRLHGLPLVLLWSVWGAGRVLSYMDFGVPQALVVAVNLMFLPLVLLDTGIRIWKARQRRQYILLLLLALLWVTEAGVLLDPQGPWHETAILVLFTLMAVVGGRITPAFSSSWLTGQGRKGQQVHTNAKLDLVAIVLLLLVGCSLLTRLDTLTIWLSMGTAAVHLFRLVLWRGWLVRAEPLLWVLHLSMLWIPLSLILLATGRMGLTGIQIWVHAAGVGAVASLILGVMARVSLGHTGRPLILPHHMGVAFVLIQVCAVIRVATAAALLPWQLGIFLSGAIWVICFGLFLWRYSPILTAPRADGKPG
ncbi:NnrS family protein [Ketobacter sp.]|uniref:NnrS family protein n=1 Tax=Ketobacter sp. TaxID=2083498 RepID=UPI000F1973E0|nr:NnrS family protein [Ketobacter sp.]RLT98698.1 MAG: NnrS family protein [Ketobacter sp.]